MNNISEFLMSGGAPSMAQAAAPRPMPQQQQYAPAPMPAPRQQYAQPMQQMPQQDDGMGAMGMAGVGAAGIAAALIVPASRRVALRQLAKMNFEKAAKIGVKLEEVAPEAYKGSAMTLVDDLLAAQYGKRAADVTKARSAVWQGLNNGDSQVMFLEMSPAKDGKKMWANFTKANSLTGSTNYGWNTQIGVNTISEAADKAFKEIAEKSGSLFGDKTSRLGASSIEDWLSRGNGNVSFIRVKNSDTKIADKILKTSDGTKTSKNALEIESLAGSDSKVYAVIGRKNKDVGEYIGLNPDSHFGMIVRDKGEAIFYNKPKFTRDGSLVSKDYDLSDPVQKGQYYQDIFNALPTKELPTAAVSNDTLASLKDLDLSGYRKKRWQESAKGKASARGGARAAASGGSSQSGSGNYESTGERL